MTPDGCCSYKHTLLVDSRWLLMAPDDSHRVSLLFNHYSQVNELKDELESSHDTIMDQVGGGKTRGFQRPRRGRFSCEKERV